ncbi:MAG: hypothetical protein ACYCXP_13560, partial [Leptospirillum sp.]
MKPATGSPESPSRRKFFARWNGTIAKVSDSYKPEKESLHSFRKYSAMEYDKRLLSFKSLSHASIATIHGRIAVP